MNKDRVLKGIITIGLFAMGGVIIKQLVDIQAEIEYFERKKEVWNTRREDEWIKKQREKERLEARK